MLSILIEETVQQGKLCPCRSLLFNNDPYQSLLFSPHFQRALTCYRVMACSPMTISHPELNPFCDRRLLLVSDQIQMSFWTTFQQLIHFICSCHMGIAIFTAHLLSHREEQHIHWTLARTRAKASQLSQKQTALLSPEKHSKTELMKLGFLSDTTYITQQTYLHYTFSLDKEFPFDAKLPPKSLLTIVSSYCQAISKHANWIPFR